MREAFQVPFRTGTRVVAKCDPRHLARVEATFENQVKVRFVESGWCGYFRAGELVEPRHLPDWLHHDEDISYPEDRYVTW